MRSTKTLLVGDLECIVLRKFWENRLETGIELEKFTLRNLIPNLCRSIDLDEKSENGIVILAYLIICYIIIGDSGVDFADDKYRAKRSYHQYNLEKRLRE